jgi:hypothetical protein
MLLGKKGSTLIFAAHSERDVRLTHGVTVALQILVLSVKVRILMGQQKKRN